MYRDKGHRWGQVRQVWQVGGGFRHGSSVEGNGSLLRNKCHASRNKCLTSSNKKLLETSATLVVTGV